MPLSEHEQRILAEIERRLLEEDPKFAHQVGHSFRARLGRRLKLAAAGLVAGMAILLVGLLIGRAWLGLAGFGAMLLAIFVFAQTLRRRASIDRPTASPTPAASRPRARGNPLESWWGRMTDRWRQRWEERGGPPPP